MRGKWTVLIWVENHGRRDHVPAVPHGHYVMALGRATDIATVTEDTQTA